MSSVKIQSKINSVGGGGLPEWINELKCGDMEGVGFGGCGDVERQPRGFELYINSKHSVIPKYTYYVLEKALW